MNIWCYRTGKLLPDRIAGFTVGAISHFDTQLRQRRLARALVRDLASDVVHEPIPVSPKLPSILSGLKVPVIVGPMNGGMDYPPNYNKASKLERLIISGLRFSAAFWNFVFAEAASRSTARCQQADAKRSSLCP